MQGQEAKLPQQVDTILLEPRDLSIHRLPNIDEKSLDREDSNFVSSIHRIEKLQVGLLRKSELMNLHTKFTDSSILASVKLFWGDTFTVTSQTLAKGTPVKITIERTISGFGNPATENAFYRANFITLFNGQPVKELTFGLTKEPGQEQKDQVSGKDKVVHILQAKVGDTFTVESLMEVKDGVKAGANSHQMLNGADAVQHRIELAAEQSHEACLQSASGQLNSGKC
ncbi:hypothetical protein [Pantanalinema sp. GBBB05]|uniref:hypothetical protein n=1 Tax=Pantanalinema sp. GBBB05 TaxID=2604139 RepID=UPI001D1E483B|nr:hypothetical protein [Pantanalinema sp. GBBB05]